MAIGLVLATAVSAADAKAQETVSPPAVSPSATKLQETITPLFKGDLPNVPGKALLAVEVSFPPGTASPPHRHPGSAFIYAYVLSGEIVSAVGDEKPHLYRAGESWHEDPGAHHTITRNASQETPAKLLVIFVVDPDQRQLVIPDKQ
jgi:quercetin dioxygenase-like cupin family protein